MITAEAYRISRRTHRLARLEAVCQAPILAKALRPAMLPPSRS